MKDINIILRKLCGGDKVNSSIICTNKRNRTWKKAKLMCNGIVNSMCSFNNYQYACFYYCSKF